MSQSPSLISNTPTAEYRPATLGIDFGIDGTDRYHAAARAALLNGEYEAAIYYSNECQDCAESGGAKSKDSYGENKRRLKELSDDSMDISRRAADALARARSEGNQYNAKKAAAECRKGRLLYEQEQGRRRTSNGVLKRIWSWLTGRGN